MSASQLTIYSSSDASGPGLLAGQANDLIRVLRACLVDGYSGKSAAGWSEPVAASGNCAGFKVGAGGSDCVVHVNDNGPNVTATYKEAWITGWEVLTGVGTVGTGSGQFPLPSQLLTTGHAVVRKSTTADGVGRVWRLAADSHTFYMFILTGDTASVYFAFVFGDIYAFSDDDTKRCLLIGRYQENSSAGNSEGFGHANLLAGPGVGHYMPRSWGGSGSSILVSKAGNASFHEYTAGSLAFGSGGIIGANMSDNSIWITPVLVHHDSQLRGRIRGLYQILHTQASFADGQTFEGGGDFAGKTFTVVKPFLTTMGGVYGTVAIETSATVETN